MRSADSEVPRGYSENERQELISDFMLAGYCRRGAAKWHGEVPAEEFNKFTRIG